MCLPGEAAFYPLNTRNNTVKLCLARGLEGVECCGLILLTWKSEGEKNSKLKFPVEVEWNLKILTTISLFFSSKFEHSDLFSV